MFCQQRNPAPLPGQANTCDICTQTGGSGACWAGGRNRPSSARQRKGRRRPAGARAPRPPHLLLTQHPRNTCPPTPLRGQNLQPSHGPPSPSGCGLEMHPKTSVRPSSPREMDKRPDGEGGWAPCTHLREPPTTRLPGGALTHLQLPAPQNLRVNGASPRQPGTRYPGQGGGAAAGRLAQARTLRPRCGGAAAAGRLCAGADPAA